MAVCFPDYENGDAFKSKAEFTLYMACREHLPKAYQVFHSVACIAGHNGEPKDGEADFLICHPDKGFLVIEVKGGGIRLDPVSRKWGSVDRQGKVYEISNPFRQATASKHAIIEKLKEHTQWPKLGLGRIVAGHAVFFPDLDDAARLKIPEAPLEIIGDRGDVGLIEEWCERAFRYWGAHAGNASTRPLGNPGVDLMRRIFARAVDVMPLMAQTLAEEEERRIHLTQQQVQILDLLSRLHRVAVSGGAGTGKTVLAVEKARRLASEGFRTLLTCYNAPLADFLKEVCSGEQNLDVMSFHKLCNQFIDKAQALTRRDLLSEAKAAYPGEDLWNFHYPTALAYALAAIEERYDAVVVDEGQDFREEFWLPTELILRNSETSPLYIFHDENQNIYTRVSTFPSDASPITLTINCRNTQQIHGAAYQYYSGEGVQAPSIIGSDVQVLEAADIEKQARKIYDLVSRLIAEEKVLGSSITVLIADKIRRWDYEKALRPVKLPKGSFWRDGKKKANAVEIESVARFKGLESDIIILWGLDTLPSEERKETLYVGLSRAKSLLYLCGTRAVCHSILPDAQSDQIKASK